MSSWQVPFDVNGHVMHSVNSWNKDKIHVLKDNVEFETTMEFVRMACGNGGATITFTDLTTGGTTYTSATEFHPMISKMVNGKLTGKFKYKKSGPTMSLVLIDEEDIFSV